jgi:hypothetical protein
VSKLAVLVAAGCLAGSGLAGAAGAAGAGGRVDDPIVGFTFLRGTAALQAPQVEVLRLRTGDTVVWTNLDPVAHDVTFQELEFERYLRNTGDTAELTFDQPGRFTYVCAQHAEIAGMNGVVYVTD